MKNIGILAMTVTITSLIVWAGLSGKKVLFIHNERSAVITLGVIGFFFCMISVGRFIETAPFNSLTLIGYILGALALFILLVQIFQWQIPLLEEPKSALLIMFVLIIIKSVIARFSHY